MFNRIFIQQEQALRQRLRQEAVESRPAYSESLHRRIMSAVLQQRQETIVVASVPLRNLPRRSRFVLAMAAACLLCAVAIGRLVTEPTLQPAVAPQPDAITAMTDPSATSPVDATNAVLSENIQPVENVTQVEELANQAQEQLNDITTASTAMALRTDDLHHDTQLAAEILLGALPLPTEIENLDVTSVIDGT
jgi:hypothetical protein